MTLKGKNNHYNVKLLRGYGVSINLKDNRIILKNGQHDITGKSEMRVTLVIISSSEIVNFDIVFPLLV